MRRSSVLLLAGSLAITPLIIGCTSSAPLASAVLFASCSDPILGRSHANLRTFFSPNLSENNKALLIPTIALMRKGWSLESKLT